MTSHLSTEPAGTARKAGHLAGLVRFALWLGLATGLAEGMVLLVRQRFTHHFIRLGADWVWMVPLSEAVVFVLAGVVAAGAANALAPRPVHRWVLAALLFLSAAVVLSTMVVLHQAAMALLAGGFAYQLSHVAVTRGALVQRWINRSLPWLVAVVAVLGVYRAAVHYVSYSHVPGMTAAESGAPNVLIVALDTVRAANLGVYGYSRPTTPVLERLAARGTVFEHAFSTAPWTLPSHASLFTGRSPRELQLGPWGPMGNAYPTLADRFSARGYRTAGFAANTIFCSYEHGLHRGFSYYSDYTVSGPQLLLSSTVGRLASNAQWLREITGYHDVPGRRTAADINHAFLTWLDRETTRPFVGFLNYFDAHEPFLPPEPFRSRFDTGKRRRFSAQAYRTNSAELDQKWKLTPEEVRAEIDAYDGAIAYLDDQVGQLLEALEKRGRLSRTIVVITSDHGEEFGEHRVFSHGHSLYLRSIHVPLLIVFPKAVPTGRRVSGAVSLVDVPATIEDLTGRAADQERLPGSSLRETWGASGRSRRPAVSERDGLRGVPGWYPAAHGDMVSVVRDGYHYIRQGDGREELFALDADPLEQHNLAGEATTEAVLRELRQISRRSQ